MNARGRHGARRLLLQALYQSQISGHDVEELTAQFSALPEFSFVDGDFFNELLSEVLGGTEALDQCIATAADRPVAQLDPVERSILWIGIAELTAHPEIPAGVVINEAVELAKEFGAEASFKYVNAILDKAAGKLRSSS
jgi:N utilization substance protein B